MANSADPDQTPQNATSDQGLHRLLELQEIKNISQPTLRDNLPTSAGSPLITFITVKDKKDRFNFTQAAERKRKYDADGYAAPTDKWIRVCLYTIK